MRNIVFISKITFLNHILPVRKQNAFDRAKDVLPTNFQGKFVSGLEEEEMFSISPGVWKRHEVALGFFDFRTASSSVSNPLIIPKWRSPN